MYFAIIPLEYGVPALVVVFIIYQIRSQMTARKSQRASAAFVVLGSHCSPAGRSVICHCFFLTVRNKKFQNLDRVLDDKAIKDLLEEEETGEDEKAKKEAEMKKKKAKVQARLAQEKKAANKKKAVKKVVEDEDDDGDLSAFVNVSKKKKN
jgi:hypothetical protein